jgi:acyl-coenzyme A thioesterase PaaI-like protein
MKNDIHNLFDSPENKEPLDEHWAAKREIADAVRRLTNRLMTCTNSAEELAQVAQQLSQQADVLEASPQLLGRLALEHAEEGRFGSFSSLVYELNPLDGRSNPIAAPLTVWVDGEQVHGRVNMGWQYEGPHNAVHGGMVAALFDQCLGIGQTIAGQPGFTGTLCIKYLKPTPLNTDLRLIGHVDRTEGRKKFMVAQMWAGDVLTATCEGTFISITPNMYKKITEQLR